MIFLHPLASFLAMFWGVLPTRTKLIRMHRHHFRFQDTPTSASKATPGGGWSGESSSARIDEYEEEEIKNFSSFCVFFCALLHKYETCNLTHTRHVLDFFCAFLLPFCLMFRVTSKARYGEAEEEGTEVASCCIFTDDRTVRRYFT